MQQDTSVCRPTHSLYCLDWTSHVGCRRQCCETGGHGAGGEGGGGERPRDHGTGLMSRELRADGSDNINWPPAARSAARYIGVLRKRKANAPPGILATLILATVLSVRSLWFWPASAKHCVKCALGLPSRKAITV